MEIDDESDLQREKLPVTNGYAFTLFSCSSILLSMKLQFHENFINIVTNQGEESSSWRNMRGVRMKIEKCACSHCELVYQTQTFYFFFFTITAFNFEILSPISIPEKNKSKTNP